MRHLIYFTASEHAVYGWKAGRLELLAHFGSDDTGLAGFREFLANRGGALFYAVAESVEEAVLNSLCAAETVIGRDGHTAHALPLDEVAALVRRSTP